VKLSFATKEFWMSYRGLSVVVMICIIVFGIGYRLTWIFDEPNEAGDTAGLINGLFSALAFAGVIYAIFLQKHELELQRQELAETREELKGQKEEFKTQNDTLKRQRFENTFFNMLQLQQQITDGITYTYHISIINDAASLDNSLPYYKTLSTTVKGREVFGVMFEDIKGYDDTISGMRTTLKSEGLKGYEENYSPTHFDHYFRHLYRIFKFVAESHLIDKEEDRYEYASMARAQLSRYELIWLYYNGLSCYGRNKFKSLIERFSLLNNLRHEMLVKDIDMGISYKSEAFRHDIN